MARLSKKPATNLRGFFIEKYFVNTSNIKTIEVSHEGAPDGSKIKYQSEEHVYVLIKSRFSLFQLKAVSESVKNTSVKTS